MDGLDGTGDEAAFRELLARRNIPPDALLAKQPETYRRWLGIFAKVHPESFLAQIRNEINRVRRQVQGLPIQREESNDQIIK